MQQASPSAPLPDVATLLWRGFRRICPRCGTTRLFDGFLRLQPACSACRQELGAIRADDFPPYVTIVVVGHLIVPSVLLTEKLLAPPIAVHLALWLPLTVALTFWLLPRIKGAIVAWMLHLGLRGDEHQ